MTALRSQLNTNTALANQGRDYLKTQALASSVYAVSKETLRLDIKMIIEQELQQALTNYNHDLNISLLTQQSKDNLVKI